VDPPCFEKRRSGRLRNPPAIRWVARYLSIPASAAAIFLQPSAFKCRLSGSAIPGCLRTEIFLMIEFTRNNLLERTIRDAVDRGEGKTPRYFASAMNVMAVTPSMTAGLND
jgi:hypothetical protein